jgi:hypothetical protein
MKNKIQDKSKEELQFVPIEKEPCETCKNKKEETLSLPLYTKDEFDFAMSIIDKQNITKEQQEFIIGLNNRALKDNKRLGCGKCWIQVVSNIKNAYKRLYLQD